MIRTLLLASLLATSWTCLAEPTTWRLISLPGIQMDFPTSWRILTGPEQVTIQVWLEAITKDARLRDVARSEQVLIHAVAPSSMGYASVQLVRSPPDAELRPEKIRRATEEQIRAYGDTARRAVESAFQGSDMRLTRWDTVRRTKVGGQDALALRYARSGPRGEVEVEQLQFSNSQAFWTATYSWRKSEAATWAPTIDRMRRTLSPTSTSAVTSSQALPREQEKKCTALVRDRTAAMVAEDWSRMKSVSERYLSSCKGIAADEDNASAWEGIATASRESRNPKATLEAANRCIDLYYRNTGCHLYKAEALFRLGRARDASRILEGADRMIDHLIQETSSELRDVRSNENQEKLNAKLASLQAQKELASAMRLAYGD